MTSLFGAESVIAADGYNKVVFDLSEGRNAYLVGGFIRDTFLERSSLDRDYVVERPSAALMERIARSAGGRSLRIGNKGLWRIVLANGGTMDFSPLRGAIEEDLLTRDFTINALAWNPETGIIDLCGGIGDIAGRQISMIDIRNMTYDPVRILRAYRLSNELNFAIETDTRRALKTLHALVGQEKPERITLEIFKLLNAPGPHTALTMMIDDGVMGTLIYRPVDTLRGKLHVVSRIAERLDLLPSKYMDWHCKVFSQGLSGAGTLRLEVFLDESPPNRLVIGKKIAKRIEGYRAACLAAGPAHGPSKGMSKENLFDLFQAAGGSALDYLIIEGLMEYIPDLEKYWRSMRDGIVTAYEVMDATTLVEGELLGRIMKRIKREDFRGKIGSKEEALRLAVKWSQV